VPDGAVQLGLAAHAALEAGQAQAREQLLVEPRLAAQRRRVWVGTGEQRGQAERRLGVQRAERLRAGARLGVELRGMLPTQAPAEDERSRVVDRARAGMVTRTRARVVDRARGVARGRARVEDRGRTVGAGGGCERACRGCAR
jgi:hypothetical protein